MPRMRPLDDRDADRASACSSSPTTPPSTLAQTLDAPARVVRRDRRPRPGLRRRQPRRHLRGRPAASRAARRLPLTVVRHEQNLGYGGNQKAGYRVGDRPRPRHRGAAARRRPVRPRVHRGPRRRRCVRGEADAVFGSRMMEHGRGPRGRHAALQVRRQPDPDRASRTRSPGSTSPSGTAATAPTASTRSPTSTSTSYSDDFDFDTEIILGLHGAGKRIVEVPIPTYYGDEICYVNGMKYAKDVSRRRRCATGRAGWASATARPRRPTPTPTSSSRPTHSSHGVLLALAAAAPPARGARRRLLRRPVRRARPRARATASTGRRPGQARGRRRAASTRSSRPTSTTACPPRPASGYDVVVAGDVLEHVVDPAAAARATCADRLAPGGEVLVSVPNFGHWYPRGRVAVGRFDYDQRGLLDHGHVRFFTRRTLRAAGRAVRAARSSSADGRLARSTSSSAAATTRASPGSPAASARVDRAATRAWPTMFGYQFLYRLERA